jgi:protein ImuB
MLWLCLYLPHFALELQPPLNTGCVAVTDRHGSRRRLIACNAASGKAGLHCGLDATTALARVPTLTLIDRTKPRERTSLNALAAWAEQYSSCVCLDAERWLLWIEIGASQGYFGGLATLTQAIELGIDSLGYTAVMGVAPTVESAALLAHDAHRTPVLRLSDLPAALASVALSKLAISVATVDVLRGIGWRTIGEMLAIPRDQLARRFGPELVRYLQRLLGECADPRQPYRAPATYRRRFELAAPVYASEALLFPLRRLLGELQGYLRARDTALQRLRLTLCHDHLPATVLELRTTAPQRDGARLLALLRERLDRTPLSSATTELIVSVDQFIPLGDTQIDLFDTTARDNTWQDLLDKLRARLGDHAVHRLGLKDDHRPEKAWCILQQGEASKLTNEADNQSDQPDRPLWLLQPMRLEQLPTLLGKPERIEAGWWSGEDIRRDYYIAETAEGSRWWLYRDASTAHWFLHGLWA